MQKLKYEIDPHNRLTVSLKRFRRVFDGKFSIGPNNTLVYHIKGPMYGLAAEEKAPHQVKLKGKWALNKNHDLVLTLDKWRRQIPGDELTLTGEIIAANASSLSFAVTTRSAKNIESKNILRLQGFWQADKYNRLSFKVRKGRGIYETLTFEGIWELNRQHRIVYRYEKSRLKFARKLKKSLIFKGHWDIIKGKRLSYQLGLDGKSAFAFSGRWKIKKNLGLLFELNHQKGARPLLKSVAFGAEARLSKRDKIEFKLKNRLGEDLGLKLVLSRKLLKGDGEAFARLLKDKQEAGIYVGAAWRW